MIDNRVVLNKADLLVSGLSSGGALAAEQAKFFIRTLIDKSTILPLVTVLPMKNPTRQIDKAKFGSRVLKAGVEAQALGLSDRSVPSTSRQTLQAHLFKAEVRLSSEVLEESIERQALRSTVMAILGERISLDMDELAVNSDTANATDLTLAQFDGMIKAANLHLVSANRNPISKSLLRDVIRAMPTPFLRDRSKLRFFMSIGTEIEYRDTMAARETIYGDRSLTDETTISYQGIPFVDAPVFPEHLANTLDQQDVLLTDPKNVNLGILREVTLETDKDISAGVFVIVATVRFDVKYTEPDAVVLATDLIHAS